MTPGSPFLHVSDFIMSNKANICILHIKYDNFLSPRSNVSCIIIIISVLWIIVVRIKQVNGHSRQ